MFVLPNLNFHAEDFVDMIKWTDITEAPMTKHITDDDLKKYMSETRDPGCQLKSIDLTCLPYNTHKR